MLPDVNVDMEQRERKRLILLIVYLTLSLAASKVRRYEEGYIHRDKEYLSSQDKTYISRIVSSSIQTRGFNCKQQYHALLLYQKALYPCMKKHSRKSNLKKDYYLGLCGRLYILKPQSDQWFSLIVFSGAYIMMSVKHFSLPWERQGCTRHGMVIALPGNPEEMLGDRYCGRRMPWNVMYKHNKVYIGVYGRQSSIYLQYFAQYNTSITAKQLIYIESNTGNYETSFSGFILSQQKKKFVYEIRIYSASLDSVLVMFRLSRANVSQSFDKLDMFDGPGKYSRLVISTNRTGGWSPSLTSTGAMFTFYYYQEQSSLALQYNHLKYNNMDKTVVMYHENKYTLFSKSNISINERAVVKLFGSDKEGLISSKLRYERVIIPVFHINKVVFRGPSQFDASGRELCQYGGVFIYKLVDKSPLLQKDICSDEHRSFIPHIMTSQHTWVVVVLWYSGYTSGYISGVVELTRCSFTIQDQVEGKQLYRFPSHSTCLNLYLTGYNKSQEFVISTTVGYHLGPVDFNIRHYKDEHSKEKCSYSFSFVECFSDADGRFTRHTSAGSGSIWNTTTSFSYPLLSHCILRLITQRPTHACPLTISISRRLCLEDNSPTFPQLLLGSDRYCKGTFEISKIPHFYVEAGNGSAYNVKIIYQVFRCDENVIIEVRDRRLQIFHYYRITAKNTIRLILTRAEITLKSAGFNKLLSSCNVTVTIKKNIIVDITEKTSLEQDWLSRKLSFVPRR